MSISRKAGLVSSALLLAAACAGAQDRRGLPPGDPLFQKLQKLDAAVFDAYNRCEVEKFESLFAEEVEFYHDQSGEMRGRGPLLDALKKNICGKVRRELVAGSLMVFPMKGYGAVQMGVHRFFQTGVEGPPGEAQFIHLWQEREGSWRITRVISYDHHPLHGH